MASAPEVEVARRSVSVNVSESTPPAKVSEAATDMLTNPGFQEAMQRYINGDSVAANSVLNKLKSTGSWISEQPPEVKRAIARQGLIQYLTSEGE